MNIGSVHRALKHIGVPRSWRDTVATTAKSLASPAERGKRRDLASMVRDTSNSEASQKLKEQGWLSVTGPFGDGARVAAGRLSQEAENLRGAGKLTPPAGGNKASFFVPVLHNADFLAMAEIMDLVTCRDLVDLATGYFGEVPVLSDVCLRWSPVNDSAQSSQLFHRDEEDATQLKFLLHVTDVDPASGPFTVLSSRAAEKVYAATGRRFGRFSDEEVFAGLDNDALHAVTGPSGTLTCIDTSRCLHFGSRGNEEERLALFFQYTRFLAPLSPTPDWGPGLAQLLPTLDPMQRRLFGRSN